MVTLLLEWRITSVVVLFYRWNFWHIVLDFLDFIFQVGFESVHFARIDYQDREKRKVDKSLEVVWRGSKTFGSSSQVCHKKSDLFSSYNIHSFFWSAVVFVYLFLCLLPFFRFLRMPSLYITVLLLGFTLKWTMTPILFRYNVCEWKTTPNPWYHSDYL